MSHPTLFYRQLIVQMIICGMTQYLAKVQTMQIEETLEKIIRNFLWADKKPPVNIATLYLPIRQGVIKLLNLRARNKAIDIMWLRSYLNLNQNRPMWAYVAIALISVNISKVSGKVSSD